MNKYISQAFFAAAAARGGYLWAINWTHGFDEVIVLALLGILAHFAFERRVAV